MVDILLTNDDGFRSIGFAPLLEELSKRYSVLAIAPLSERSWIGKAISLEKVTIQKEKLGNRECYSCTGTPADCVQIGLYNLLTEKPKIVLSGINIGANVGVGRILSSGTIGAGMEASIAGIKAIASSFHFPNKANFDLQSSDNYHLLSHAVAITMNMIDRFMANEWEKNVDILSINIPPDATKDSPVEMTVPDRSSYGQLYQEQNGTFIRKIPRVDTAQGKKGTDTFSLHQGNISLTPISLDLKANS